MEFYKKTFSKADFSSIPEQEKVLFVKITALLNELNILQKVTLLSYNNLNSPNDTIKRAQLAQTNFFILLTIGKLNEGWKTITNNFFNSKISKEYSDLFDKETKEGIEYLKKYFFKREYN